MQSVRVVVAQGFPVYFFFAAILFLERLLSKTYGADLEVDNRVSSKSILFFLRDSWTYPLKGKGEALRMDNILMKGGSLGILED